MGLHAGYRAPRSQYERDWRLLRPSFLEYTQGGFTDEFGKRHESVHHYSIPYWEVLNDELTRMGVDVAGAICGLPEAIALSFHGGLEYR